MPTLPDSTPRSASGHAQSRGIPAVSVEHLTVAYGRVTAVDDVTFAAFPGRVMALLGPNGAGKTSTVEAIVGLRTPTSGSMNLLGRDPRDTPELVRNAVGLLPQTGGIHPQATVGQVLAHRAALYADPVSPDSLIDRFALRPRLRTQSRRLSGGELQRLRLAAALVGRPRVAFLDEPTAALDPQARRLVWEVIDELRASGAAVVLTTHLIEDADRLADDVVIMRGGRIVAAGTPAELTAAAAGGGDLVFRGPVGLSVTSLESALPERCSVVEASPGRYRVDGGADPQVVAAVMTWCAAHGILADELRTGARSLEELVLELTGNEVR